MILKSLCPPALIYLIFTVTQIGIDVVKGYFNTAFMKLWQTVIFTILLQFLCNAGLGIISLIIVFIPFMLMTVITVMLLTVFGLDPKSGKLKVYDQPPLISNERMNHSHGHTHAPKSNGAENGNVVSDPPRVTGDLQTKETEDEEVIHTFNPQSLNKTFETKTSLFNFNKDGNGIISPPPSPTGPTGPVNCPHDGFASLFPSGNKHAVNIVNHGTEVCIKNNAINFERCCPINHSNNSLLGNMSHHTCAGKVDYFKLYPSVDPLYIATQNLSYYANNSICEETLP